MNVPRFDVFSGLLNKNALWIESVQGLGAAYERMKELAADRPGPYFVFDAISHKILAKTDTTKPVIPIETVKSDIDDVA
jgi:hypothetical protein